MCSVVVADVAVSLGADPADVPATRGERSWAPFSTVATVAITAINSQNRLLIAITNILIAIGSYNKYILVAGLFRAELREHALAGSPGSRDMIYHY